MAKDIKDITRNLSFDTLDNVDRFLRVTQPLGSHGRAISNNLYGINHRNVKGVIPENRDSYGLVFFTRPQLNLSSGNLRNIRKFYNLLTTNEKSIHRYVRCMLDPRLSLPDGGYGQDYQNMAGLTPAEQQNKELMDEVYNLYGPKQVISPLVDEGLGFIPILTNTLKSLKGWPDITLPTFTSKEGLKREQWSIADGMIDIYESFDLDCTFRNIKDEPLVLMFETWLRYMALVFEGMIGPYMDFMVENEIDYNTRIYRIVLDESKTFVKKIAAVGAAFPVNVPNGAFFDFEDTEKYNQASKDINIRFKCMGAEYNDDILIEEFNMVTKIFNTEMFDADGKITKNFAKIPYNLLDLFNNRGYPLIDKNTLELCWYVRKDSKFVQEITKAYQLKLV